MTSLEVPNSATSLGPTVVAAELPDHALAEIARLDDQVATFAGKALSDATVEAYTRDMARFMRWCALRGEQSLPSTPVTLARYLVDAATTLTPKGAFACSPRSLTRWVASINYAHRIAGFAPPGNHPHVERVLAGIRNDRKLPPRRMRPLLLYDIKVINTSTTAHVVAAGAWPAGLAARRDTALLMMGFVGAYRRSELAGLLIGDVTSHRLDGLHVRLRHSKSDQEGQGLVKALPFGTTTDSCAPCAYTRWLDVLLADATGGTPAVLRLVLTTPGCTEDTHCCKGIRRPADLERLLDQPLFRPISKGGTIAGRSMSGHAINLIIKKRASDAGYPSTDLGGHSLRAGFVTQGFRAGADAHAIMRQTGHKSISMLTVYQREHAPLTGNAVTQIGL
jgi:site-specific recombinase XerD